MRLFLRRTRGVQDDGDGRDGSGRHDGDGHDGDGHDGDEKTVRIARKRFGRRQWARRRLAWPRIVVALLLVALVAGSAWLLFFSTVLAVSGVQVVGTGVLSPDAVRRAAAVPTGAPLATVDLDSVTTRVERLPAVRSVDVSRSWPDRVRVAVTERRPVAVVAAASQDGQDGRLRALDATGVVFSRYASRPRGLPLIRMGRRTGTDALAEAATVAGSLPAGVAADVRSVEVRTVDTISLTLRSGTTVRWGSAEQSVDKARVLRVLLRQQAAFYDVSVPGQPILRK